MTDQQTRPTDRDQARQFLALAAEKTAAVENCHLYTSYERAHLYGILALVHILMELEGRFTQLAQGLISPSAESPNPTGHDSDHN